MYFIAIMGDIFGLIPFVNIVTDAITAVALYIAGKETGADIYDDQLPLTLATIVGEAVPVLSVLPLWTLRVWWAKKRKAKREAADEQYA